MLELQCAVSIWIIVLSPVRPAPCIINSPAAHLVASWPVLIPLRSRVRLILGVTGALQLRRATVLSWSNYVALGDSLTAGRDDHGPAGARIGWAQRLAGILSTRTAVPCALINLAADGARVSTILEQQLPPVGRLGPDLVSVTVGMNDISDPGFILDRFADQFGRLLDGLMLPGATGLTC